MFTDVYRCLQYFTVLIRKDDQLQVFVSHSYVGHIASRPAWPGIFMEEGPGASLTCFVVFGGTLKPLWFGYGLKFKDPILEVELNLCCVFFVNLFFLGWDQFSGSQALRSHCSALHRHTTPYYITVATRKKIGQINSQNRAFWIWIVMNCVSLP